MQEDPTFRVHTDKDTGQTLISGMGELHLEIITDRLVREFNVGANVGKPQVAYKETITVEAEGEGRYIRQTGGRGQFGHAKIRMRPTTEADYIFNNKIVGGVIPKEFIKPIDQGIKEALETGPLAGFPCTGVEVDLYDGSFHDVDSSEIAFKIAGSMAFQDACKRARPVLMEPIMAVEVVTPEDYMGEVIGDITSRRGRMQSMEARGNAQVINCRVPLVGDVRLRDRPAVAFSGACQLHHAVRRLRAGPQERQRRGRGQGRRLRLRRQKRKQRERSWARKSSSVRSRTSTSARSVTSITARRR